MSFQGLKCNMKYHKIFGVVPLILSSLFPEGPPPRHPNMYMPMEQCYVPRATKNRPFTPDGSVEGLSQDPCFPGFK